MEPPSGWTESIPPSTKLLSFQAHSTSYPPEIIVIALFKMSSHYVTSRAAQDGRIPGIIGGNTNHMNQNRNQMPTNSPPPTLENSLTQETSHVDDAQSELDKKPNLARLVNQN